MSMLPGFLRKASEVTKLVPTTNVKEDKQQTSQGVTKLHEDPFNREGIKEVFLHYRQFWKSDPWECIGHITFTSGDTSGRQDFKGPTIEDVLEKMAIFIKSL